MITGFNGIEPRFLKRRIIALAIKHMKSTFEGHAQVEIGDLAIAVIRARAEVSRYFGLKLPRLMIALDHESGKPLVVWECEPGAKDLICPMSSAD